MPPSKTSKGRGDRGDRSVKPKAGRAGVRRRRARRPADGSSPAGAAMLPKPADELGPQDRMEHAERYLALGESECEDGRYKTALACFRTAIRSGAADAARARFGMADALAGLDRHREAYRQYRKAEACGGSRARARLGMAGMRAKLGMHEKAVEQYGEAERLGAGKAQALGGMAYSLAKIGRRKEASEILERAAKEDPERAAEWAGRCAKWGRIEYKGERHAEAAVCYEKAASIDPGNADALRGWADSLAEAGRHEEAAGIIARAARLDGQQAQ